jgi:hypothetical protein
MKARQLRLVSILGTALFCQSLVAPANPLQFPKRSVSGRTVNLKPLFKWWGTHDGSRPLPAWQHVIGSVVATNSYGWVLQAEIPERPQTGNSGGFSGKIVLKNPPYQDMAAFEKLSAQYKTLAGQKAEMAAAESRAKSNADSIRQQRQATGGHARGAGQAQRAAQRTGANLKAQIKNVDTQMEEVRKKLETWPNAEHYVVDCMALDLGQLYRGDPVFDHGVALN